MENYSVAISYKNDLGYVEYDSEKKSAEVTLANDEGKQATENFLSETHDIEVPHKTLLDFTVEKIDPLESVKSFQLALTRLWEATGVHVDWSRPVDYVKTHPFYDTDD
ncbi:MAG: hypothetical protein IJ728_01745 [Selenomonadaceae bacterium]|nr:hypothetical protein [Selenomonadaceae bacterium]